MSNDPAFLFYPGDYLRDTQCLSERVQVAYDRIMCEHMRSICIAQQRLDFFTKRLNDQEKIELMSVLAMMDGGFCIDWVYQSIMKRRAYSESRSKNGKKKQEKHMQSICSAQENEIVSENFPPSTPNAFNTTTLKKAQVFNFEDVWSLYPSRVGKKAALRHFNTTVKNEKDLDNIHLALENYKNSERVKKGIIQNGSTWFNNWNDWIDYKDPVTPIDEEKELLRKAGLINDTTSRTSSKRSFHEG